MSKELKDACMIETPDEYKDLLPRWVLDPSLPKNMIYVIDPDSLYIENGIVKFTGKFVPLPDKLQKHKGHVLGREIPQ